MTQRQIFISLILSVIGLAVWLAISKLSNKVEAWDSDYYYVWGLPIMFVAAAIAGFIEPKFHWRWAFFVIILQPVALTTQSDIGPFAILGMFFFFFFFLMAGVSAFLGKIIRERMDR